MDSEGDASDSPMNSDRSDASDSHYEEASPGVGKGGGGGLGGGAAVAVRRRKVSLQSCYVPLWIRAAMGSPAVGFKSSF